MKALIVHCKHYRTSFHSFATRPKNILPEPIKFSQQECCECVVALITVEVGDREKEHEEKMATEIEKTCEDVKKQQVVLIPFAHLSNNLAPSQEALEVLKNMEEILSKKFTVTRAHFGSHKSLLLNIHGHPGNVRYREFNM